MGWTLAFDERSFVEPITRRYDSLFAELRKPGVDRDQARALIAQIDSVRGFMAAIKAVDGPCAELVPVTLTPPLGDLYVLRVDGWRAYYLLDAAAQSVYGVLVTHGSEATADRLRELIKP